VSLAIILHVIRAGVPPPQPDPKAMQQQAAGKRLQQTQAQVNEVSVSLMFISIITWWSCLPHLLFPTLLRAVCRC